LPLANARLLFKLQNAEKRILNINTICQRLPTPKKAKLLDSFEICDL
tara:strand:+ start:89783 stop:89923 length:141 start_codon:yes stop_codon:yes gene_type:complete